MQQVAASLPRVVYDTCAFRDCVRAIGEAAKAWSPPDGGKAEVVSTCIARVYGCTREAATALEVDVLADNAEEHQRDVNVYRLLMIALCNDAGVGPMYVTPVEGTYVECGRVVPVEVYNGIAAGGATYARMTLYMLWTFATHDAACLPNVWLQTVEACVNCTARVREVFEYTVRAFVAEGFWEPKSGGAVAATPTRHGGIGAATSADRSNASPQVACAHEELNRAALAALAPAFRWWLDAHKRDALYAAVLNPLLYFTHRDYSTYENISNHGAGLWGGAITACLGIPMPIERRLDADADDGWVWAALALDYKSPWVKEVLAVCAKGIGRGWRGCVEGCEWWPLRPPPPRDMRIEGCGRYGVVGEVFHALEHAPETLRPAEIRQFLRPLHDFAALLAPDILAERFALHLLRSSTHDHLHTPTFHPSEWVVNADDPAHIAIDTAAVIERLALAGVDLRATRSVAYPSVPLPPAPGSRQVPWGCGIKREEPPAPAPRAPRQQPSPRPHPPVQRVRARVAAAKAAQGPREGTGAAGTAATTPHAKVPRALKAGAKREGKEKAKKSPPPAPPAPHPREAMVAGKRGVARPAAGGKGDGGGGAARGPAVRVSPLVGGARGRASTRAFASASASSKAGAMIPAAAAKKKKKKKSKPAPQSKMSPRAARPMASMA